MNSFWNFLDWILPSVRLTDDLENSYPLSDDGSSVHTTTSASSPPRVRLQQQPLLDRTRDRNREREREQSERLRAAEQEREHERQRVQTLERENAALRQRISQLETDLRSAHQTVATYSLLTSPTLPTPNSQPQPLPQYPQMPDTVHLRATYDSMLTSYSAVQRALQERTEEIASLKTFLSKTDEWSGAQLIQALRDLNAEIVQLAASVAEEFSGALDRRVDLVRASDRELVTNALGVTMADLLATRDHTGDPTLVQFAIQAWEVWCVGRVLDMFCFGLPPEVDQLLSRIFDHMHHSEPQPTTSRWRALTHMHSRMLLPLASQTQQPAMSPFATLNETNLRGLLAVLALAGCTDARGVHRDPLRARFGGALVRIGERAERISSIVKEGVMSGAFDVVWVGGKSMAAGKKEKDDRWFDWATMENVYAGHGSERSKVLCTVEFGLMCVRRVEGGDPAGTSGSMTNGNANGNGELVDVNGYTNGYTKGTTGVNNYSTSNGAGSTMMRSLLLKPKVLLESVAEIL